MRNPYLYALYTSIALIIINPKISACGAANGVMLWINIIIPTLFPFIIISNMLLNVYGKSFKNPVFFTILIGCLCGFPICGSLVSKMHKENLIDSHTCQYLVNCFSMPSPMFIISFAANYILENYNTLPFILLVYGSNIIMSTILFFLTKPTYVVVHNATNNTLTLRNFIKMLDTEIYNASQSILKIGGYIIIFSMVSYFVTNLPYLFPSVKTFLAGICEISSGLNLLKLYKISKSSLLILTATFISFGGLCTLAQTYCVIEPGTISFKKYMLHKTLVVILTYILRSIFIN